MSEAPENEATAAGQSHIYPVCRAVNRSLTILGAERRLFFLAAIMAGAAFNFFGSLRAAGLIYAALYLSARAVTSKDPALPRILLNSAHTMPRYDARLFEPPRIVETDR